MYLEEKARVFATAAHAAVKQVRKYTGEPYIVHPAAVVALVKSVPHTELMVCAAWLHDVIEDTGVKLELIAKEFGSEIATAVNWLTDQAKPSDGNRKARKKLERERIAHAPYAVKTVKLADLIDNSKSIFALDPDFAKVYLQEKELLLDVLSDGDQTLYKQAKQICEEFTGIIH